MSNLKDRIQRDQDAYSQLLAWVPGFKGYREQGSRREADRLLRQHLAALLANTQDKVRKAMGDLAKRGRLGQLGLLDAVGKRIEKLTDLIRHADAGYSGWFDAVKIKEDDLDRLYDYDLSLREFITDVDAAVSEALASPEDSLASALERVSAALDELEHMIGNRKQLALSLMP